MTETPKKDDARDAGPGHNSGAMGAARDDLRAYVDRIERIHEIVADHKDDLKQVYAEAKATGYDTKTIRRIVKRRTYDKSERAEMDGLQDLYEEALGMAERLPLFAELETLAGEKVSQDGAIEALKKLVPADGEIIMRVGSGWKRFWREGDGEAKVADTERPQRRVPAEDGQTDIEDAPILPDVDEAGAHALGREAAGDGQAVIANPFPAADPRRPAWDEGWREGAGGDGMGEDPDGEGEP